MTRVRLFFILEYEELSSIEIVTSQGSTTYPDWSEKCEGRSSIHKQTTPLWHHRSHPKCMYGQCSLVSPLVSHNISYTDKLRDVRCESLIPLFHPSIRGTPSCPLSYLLTQAVPIYIIHFRWKPVKITLADLRRISWSRYGLSLTWQLFILLVNRRQ